MKLINLLMIAVSALLMSQKIFAAKCGEYHVVPVGSQNVPFFKIDKTPESRLTSKEVKSQMLVSGIYQFVRKGAKWDIYRCAKPNTNPPIYDANSCVIKNDFQFGSFVAKSSSGQSLQKISVRGPNVLGISMPSAVDSNEVLITFKDDGVVATEEAYVAPDKNKQWDRKLVSMKVAECKYNTAATVQSGPRGSAGSSSNTGSGRNSN